ncbi:MAG: hypothetical protein SH868_01225 [Bythopirellula sp.]|nr:hypothetical protein [Bythopirellula sp.]
MSLRHNAVEALHALLGPKATDKIRQLYRRWRHSSGTLTWATKSYEVWLILQTELYLVQPRFMVEFGSGRSTNYLAEYAFKQGARLISIEEHAVYTKKANRVLSDSFLPDNLVHHIPVREDWYDPQQVEILLQPFAGKIDFLFLDGPSNVGPGERSSQAFAAYLLPKLAGLQLAVVDDVHRPECDAIARLLADTFGMTRHDVAYGKANLIAFLHTSTVAAKLEPLPDFLRQFMVQVNPHDLSVAQPGDISTQVLSEFSAT